VFDAIAAYGKREKLPDYIRVNDFVINSSNINQYMSFGF
jgi:hypothetical protein